VNIPFVVTLRISKDGTSGYATRVVHAHSRELLNAKLQRHIPRRLDAGEAFQVVAVTTLYQLEEQHGTA
jgi:hypothetical protein